MSNIPSKTLVPVYRPVKSGDTNAYPSTATHSEYIHIQPQDPVLVITDSSFSKTRRGFADSGADFNEMDEIVYKSKRFRLMGVSDYDFGGMPHLEISLEEVQ